MKKYVSFLMAAACSVSLLVGCSSGNTEQEQPEEAKTEETQEDVQESSDAYLIYVMDSENMAPIPNVKVQFCSDTMCNVGKTDESGIAAFPAEPGTYTVHLMKVPEGYEKSTEEFTLDKDTREATFFLEKKETDAQSQTGTDSEKTDSETDFPLTGFTFTTPDEFNEISGEIRTRDWGEMEKDSGLVMAYVSYQAKSETDFVEYLNSIGIYTMEDATDDKMEEISSFYDRSPNVVLFRILGVRADQDVEEVKKQTFLAPIVVFDEIGTAGDYTFYYVVLDEEETFEEIRNYDDYPQDRLEEAQKLWEEAATTSNFKDRITVKEPISPFPTIEEGTVVSFKTEDLDGNSVTSKDLFADHKITMINIWATWCSNCKDEMEELEAMSKEWADKGVQIIGLCALEEDETAEDAKKVLDKYGVTYPNICMNKEINEQLVSVGLPTTYFVDSEGHILCDPVTGKYPEQYVEALEKLLSEMK